MEIHFAQRIGRIVGENQFLFSFDLMILVIQFGFNGVANVLLPIPGLAEQREASQNKNKGEKFFHAQK